MEEREENENFGERKRDSVDGGDRANRSGRIIVNAVALPVGYLATSDLLTHFNKYLASTTSPRVLFMYRFSWQNNFFRAESAETRFTGTDYSHSIPQTN